MLSLVTTLSMMLTACGNDDDEPTMDNIVGTWKLTEASTDNGKTFTKWTLEKTTATFNENGTY